MQQWPWTASDIPNSQELEKVNSVRSMLISLLSGEEPGRAVEKDSPCSPEERDLGNFEIRFSHSHDPRKKLVNAINQNTGWEMWWGRSQNRNVASFWLSQFLLALPNWDPSSSANFSSCELLPFGDTAVLANVLLVGFGPLLLNVILWEVCLFCSPHPPGTTFPGVPKCPQELRCVGGTPVGFITWLL